MQPLPPENHARVLSPLAKKLMARHALGSRDLRLIGELHTKIDRIPKGTDIIVEGCQADTIHIVVDGWAARYRVLVDGGRQILNFAVPGDLLGIQLAMLSCAEHSVCAVSDLSVARFPAADLDTILRDHPALAKAIRWSGVREWAMVCEHLINIGRRPAIDRIAHLLLELRARLRLVGRATDERFELPLTQDMIADCLGLTHVHVSRSMRRLKERELIKCERRQLIITDASRLAEEFDFSDHYLDHKQRLAN